MTVLASRLPAAPVPTVQRSLRVGAATDPVEVEAEAVADAVLRMPIAEASTALQRCAGGSPAEDLVQRCPGGCPGEEELRRQAVDDRVDAQLARQPADRGGGLERTGGGLAVDAATVGRLDAARGGGAALPAATRGFFEPRFGADFSAVRVHADHRAAGLAASVNARAFTVGRDMFFGAGEYRPGTAGGDRLLAHELTHTVQQDPSAAPVRRTVHPTRSQCPANANGAPADPMAELQAADAEAQRMALGASHVLFVESLVRTDPVFGPGPVSTAYIARFGSPEPVAGGRFRNRFTGGTAATLDDAINREMRSLSDRFERISRFLGGSIEYDCHGTERFTIGSCAGRCGANDGAHSCAASHGRKIVICRGFWTTANEAQRAGMLVHEAAHMLFGFRQHGSGTVRQRGRNPECYTSFLADIETFATWDQRCPV